MRLKIPDPFRAGRFFEFDSRTPLGNCGDKKCPICAFVRVEVQKAKMAASATGFALLEGGKR